MTKKNDLALSVPEIQALRIHLRGDKPLSQPMREALIERLDEMHKQAQDLVALVAHVVEFYFPVGEERKATPKAQVDLSAAVLDQVAAWLEKQRLVATQPQDTYAAGAWKKTGNAALTQRMNDVRSLRDEASKSELY